MKDYKEMTESVLQQAKVRSVQQKHQRRLATGLIAGMLCLAVLICAVGFGVGRNPGDTTQPTISLENPATDPTTQPGTTEPIAPPTEMKVYFLSSNAKQVSHTQFLQGVRIPVDGIIRVRSFAGLSEEERELVILEEEAINNAYRAENWAELTGGSSSVQQAQTAMTSLMINGCISLEFADKNHVSSVDVETTEMGGAGSGYMCYKKDVTYGEGENKITFPVGSMRYVVFWGLSNDMEQKLLSNPSMPLSAISDTITITVNYSNGAQQTLIIDVTVDDAGQIYMTQRFDEAVV